MRETVTQNDKDQLKMKMKIDFENESLEVIESFIEHLENEKVKLEVILQVIKEIKETQIETAQKGQGVFQC